MAKGREAIAAESKKVSYFSSKPVPCSSLIPGGTISKTCSRECTRCICSMLRTVSKPASPISHVLRGCRKHAELHTRIVTTPMHFDLRCSVVASDGDASCWDDRLERVKGLGLGLKSGALER